MFDRLNDMLLFLILPRREQCSSFFVVAYISCQMSVLKLFLNFSSHDTEHRII